MVAPVYLPQLFAERTGLESGPSWQEIRAMWKLTLVIYIYICIYHSESFPCHFDWNSPGITDSISLNAYVSTMGLRQDPLLQPPMCFLGPKSKRQNGLLHIFWRCSPFFSIVAPYLAGFPHPLVKRQVLDTTDTMAFLASRIWDIPPPPRHGRA